MVEARVHACYSPFNSVCRTFTTGSARTSYFRSARGYQAAHDQGVNCVMARGNDVLSAFGYDAPISSRRLVLRNFPVDD
jgi:hypothetical protein